MHYKVIFISEKIINKDLSKIPEKSKLKILDSLKNMQTKWLYYSDFKKLNHYDLCDYRLRIWDYRILFNLNYTDKEITVFRILHRLKLY